MPLLLKELGVLNKRSENGSASKTSFMKIVSLTSCGCSRGFFLHKATLGNDIASVVLLVFAVLLAEKFTSFYEQNCDCMFSL